MTSIFDAPKKPSPTVARTPFGPFHLNQPQSLGRRRGRGDWGRGRDGEEGGTPSRAHVMTWNGRVTLKLHGIGKIKNEKVIFWLFFIRILFYCFEIKSKKKKKRNAWLLAEDASHQCPFLQPPRPTADIPPHCGAYTMAFPSWMTIVFCSRLDTSRNAMYCTWLNSSPSIGVVHPSTALAFSAYHASSPTASQRQPQLSECGRANLFQLSQLKNMKLACCLLCG